MRETMSESEVKDQAATLYLNPGMMYSGTVTVSGVQMNILNPGPFWIRIKWNARKMSMMALKRKPKNIKEP